MNRKIQKSYVILIIFLYLVVFIPLVTQKVSFLNYWDELISSLAIPVWFLRFSRNKTFIISKKYIKLSYSFWIILSVLFTLLNNIVFKLQPFLRAVLPDLFINIKFWLSIYVGISFFQRIDLQKQGKLLSKNIKRIVLLFLILFIIDKFFDIFKGDTRYGIKSTWLFYEIHSYFALICVYLLCLLTIVKDETKYYWLYAALLLFFMASTLRSKAFGGVVLFILIYYWLFRFHKKINFKTILMISIPIIGIAFSQIQEYFFSTDVRARASLMITSIEILKDYFPLGTGFSSFASYYSGIIYSPLYSMYGIDNVYGLTKDHPAFICDSFWPMIIAQNGFLGCICFIIALLKLFKNIQLIRYVNVNSYFAALFVFLYLCISSTAESSFVHTMSVPYGIVLGICLSKKSNKTR